MWVSYKEVKWIQVNGFRFDMLMWIDHDIEYACSEDDASDQVISLHQDDWHCSLNSLDEKKVLKGHGLPVAFLIRMSSVRIWVNMMAV